MTLRPALAALAAVLVVAPAATAQAGPTMTTQVIASHDGTPIVSHLFLPPGASAEDPVPLVLRSHGWAGSGETAPAGLFQKLLDAGYAVMTWDQRGFGCSGGEVNIVKPDIEGRDVSALLDWVSANAPIATDADGDPIVGFTGGSYAGGIQTATASLDPRIDAIAPEISWTDLRYSLYSGTVINQGWAAVLYGAGAATATAQGLSPSCPGFAEYGPQAGGLHPLIHQGFAEGATTGTVSDEVLTFFAGSSLTEYATTDPVTVPALVIQGSVDTLFDLTDGYGVFTHVRDQGAPARFLIYCGGHVACPGSYADAGDRDHIDAAILAWFARHLRGDTTLDTGAPVEYRTNEGIWRTAADFPPAGSGYLHAEGTGDLVSIPGLDPPDPAELAGYLDVGAGGLPGLPITVAQPASALELAAGQAVQFEVAAATDGPLELLGIPEVTLAVEGTGAEVILLVRLVDREAGEVVNLQEGAIRVPLGDAAAAEGVAVPMPGLAYTLPEGHHLDLEVATSSLMHSNARTPATVQVSVSADIPAGVAPAPAAPPTPPAGVEEDVISQPLPTTGAGFGLGAAMLLVALWRPRGSSFHRGQQVFEHLA